MARLSNQERARKLAGRIASQVRRGAGKGLQAAAIFLVARVKETLGVQAPRRKVKSRKYPGEVYYVATTSAVRGAPPRRVSGEGQQGMTYQMKGPYTALIGSTARSVPPWSYPYMKHHETPGFATRSGEHRFILPTVQKWRVQLRRIVGAPVRLKVTGHAH